MGITDNIIYIYVVEYLLCLFVKLFGLSDDLT